MAHYSSETRNGRFVQSGSNLSRLWNSRLSGKESGISPFEGASTHLECLGPEAMP
jgi:hypothetical protein